MTNDFKETLIKVVTTFCPQVTHHHKGVRAASQPVKGNRLDRRCRACQASGEGGDEVLRLRRREEGDELSPQNHQPGLSVQSVDEVASPPLGPARRLLAGGPSLAQTLLGGQDFGNRVDWLIS